MAQNFEDSLESNTQRHQCLAGNGRNPIPRDFPPLVLPQIQTRKSTEDPTGFESEINGSPVSQAELSPSSPLGDSKTSDVTCFKCHVTSPKSFVNYRTSHVTSSNPASHVPSNATQLVIEDSVSRRANSIPDSFLLSPSPVCTYSSGAALKLLPQLGACQSCQAKSAGGSPVTASGPSFWAEKSHNARDGSVEKMALGQNFLGGTNQRDRINQCQDNAGSLHASLLLLSAKKYGKWIKISQNAFLKAAYFFHYEEKSFLLHSIEEIISRIVRTHPLPSARRPVAP